jgi:hypothetical protein
VASSSEHGNVSADSVNDRKFLNQLSNCHLVRKDNQFVSLAHRTCNICIRSTVLKLLDLELENVGVLFNIPTFVPQFSLPSPHPRPCSHIHQ